jgi:hypothetical protein
MDHTTLRIHKASPSSITLHVRIKDDENTLFVDKAESHDKIDSIGENSDKIPRKCRLHK